MDRNSFIGLVLIGAILIAYSIYTAPTQEEIDEQRQVDSLAMVENKLEEVITAPPSESVEVTADSLVETNNVLGDSIADIQRNSLFGEFSVASKGEESFLTVETDKMILTFSNKGGRIVSVNLKDYRRHDSTPLILFDQEGSTFNLNFFTNSNKNIFSDELFFETSERDMNVTGKDDFRVSYTLFTNDRAKSLTMEYNINPSDFMLKLNVLSENMDQVIDTRGDEIQLNWAVNAPSQEKSIESQRQTSTVYYKYSGESPEYISETSEEREDLVASIDWIAFKQQYFTSALIADVPFDNFSAFVETQKDEESDYVKTMSASVAIPIEHRKSELFAMQLYFGPNHFQTLEDYEIGLESLIPLGWGIFGWVNEWLVIPIFNFLDGFDLNYGIIILLMTIFIKLLLFPITYKTYLSSAKMKVLKPEISEIGEKHKDDAMKKQQATMALYKKAGVNPLAGCVPMLIQMPILFAMFRFFPASIELRQQSFLWADDLSSYDSIMSLPFDIPFYGDHVSLFTLLMAISMVFYTRINSGQMGMDTGGAGSEMMATQMKIMMYLMPIMMLFFFNSYSSGLSYYYFIANVISMGQMLAIKNWIIDEDKIHAQIQMNKAKPQSQKKSRFQKRLEEMAKQRGYQPKKK
ncbi:MAG: membrane protein insertase YidC [Vicingaceae bacterium]